LMGRGCTLCVGSAEGMLDYLTPGSLNETFRDIETVKAKGLMGKGWGDWSGLRWRASTPTGRVWWQGTSRQVVCDPIIITDRSSSSIGRSLLQPQCRCAVYPLPGPRNTLSELARAACLRFMYSISGAQKSMGCSRDHCQTGCATRNGPAYGRSSIRGYIRPHGIPRS
jgi:hypothetical protein